MVTVLDLVVGFDEFAAGGLEGDLVDRWHREVVEPDAEIFTAVRSWVDPGAAPDRIPGLIGQRANLRARAGQAKAAVRKAATLLADLLDGEQPIRAVVMVGLRQANGWVAPVRVEPTLFLAVEQLPEPPFDVVLALHELIHLVHQRRSARDWPSDRLDADLFREGLAVHATGRLMPEVSRSGHLWFRSDAGVWLDRCAERADVLRNRALRELVRTDVSEQWFSGAIDRPGELPGRCGYWLGWQLLDQIIGGEPLETALEWPLSTATVSLRAALSGSGGG
ncbi:hypothetical protein O7626_13115 [Micromonospora sp. WMMD1102]|uniref:hypothetical protein n=1 Tax=Micromonospora sp. WMMD1102 TaxID=3016105 RepID=UPI002414F25E|nr:hypothetical protein [Micromonospora sp. WMMD1102]MDG4786858.1 hypothetical protein [Micromonospora sp. WMMD1102]